MHLSVFVRVYLIFASSVKFQISNCKTLTFQTYNKSWIVACGTICNAREIQKKNIFEIKINLEKDEERGMNKCADFFINLFTDSGSYMSYRLPTLTYFFSD